MDYTVIGNEVNVAQRPTPSAIDDAWCLSPGLSLTPRDGVQLAAT